ncbi:MAG: twin-arginine translocase TatA/TatE family subunit [Pseudomonadota bacterium]|jgi:sec-independent protein translocase protein TatA
MGLRLPELLVILVIVVLIFGAGKLPQLGDALGRGIRNFKKATNGDEAQAKADEAKGEKKAD